ncbi:MULTISPECIES: ATP-binding cassette domain-containing protein [unclassified Streptomyces]|uniref:ABC transporter ATP-binding protein n=1 Tax=unclassified Streptomyces TaxID=2593676 RepID=UPI000DC24928|nr:MULTISPECIES: ATP-binding cassette domain-containing protein [unclassified Streptomyces]RAJ85010.1 ABC transporter family protein [Streptomyces sp. PsTaAH-137]
MVNDRKNMTVPAPREATENGTSASPVLEAVGLGKTYGDAVAVDDVSFTLAAGECLAVVGESGSGKTTVARMLLGLENRDAGVLTVCGRPRPARGRLSSRERRRRAREIQIVFQDPYSSLDRLQSVGDVVETALALHFPMEAAERHRRVVELLDSVGLAERHLPMRPAQLSGGQRQRVALARALAVEPRILVLDEAVAALDVSIQAQILNLLADVREQRDISYVFISHDLAVVHQISDRALVMCGGRVVEQGPTGRLLTDPREEYTRQLRAAVPGPGWQPSRRTRPA